MSARALLAAIALASCLTLGSPGHAYALLRNWTGYGDGTSWSDGDNWAGGVVPGPGDEVLLDNLDAQQDYTVLLPAGAVSVSISRLTISPSAGGTITLVLPVGNTANPGLRVGDGVAGTDDIVLRAGAVLRNASGASFGNGVELLALTNGTVRIENGARYVHSTVRSASGVAPFLSVATGTELGEFEYDVPGTATSNIAASGRTYGSLTLSRSSGAATYGALGAGVFTVRGRFRIGPGVTFSSNMTGPVHLGGDVVNDGFTWVVPGAQAVVWNGGTTQTLSGPGGVRLLGAGSIQDGTTLAVNASLLGVENTLAIAGTLRLGQSAQAVGTGAYQYHPTTGKLVFDQAAGSFVVAGGPFWPATSGPSQVVVQGAGVTMQVARTVSASLIVAAPVADAHQLTITGALELHANGSLSGSPVYAGEGRLVYAAARTVGAEWVAGATVGPGVPKHVVVRPGAGTVQLPSSLRTVPGDLTIDSGALRLDPVLRVVELHGSFTTAVAQGVTQGALRLAGGGHQRLTGPAGFALDFLRSSKTGGAIELLSDLAVTAPGGGNALEWNGTTDELWIAGRHLALSGAVNGTNPGGRLRGGAGARLSLTTTAAAGVIGFAPGAETLQDFTVAAAGGVTLATGVVVENTLTLTSGVVTTGTHTLALGTAGTVVRTSGRVSGRLRKPVALGAPTVRFEVGSAQGYAPVTLEFTNVTSAGAVTASSIAGDHPTLAGSGLDPARTVNRHWVLEPSGLAFGGANAIFQFLFTDRDPGTTPTNFAVRRHDGAAWSPTTTGFRTATSTQAVGLGALGTFAVGDEVPHTLSVTVVGGGNVSRSPDLPTYPYGSTVTLTAIPAMEYHFQGWAGDASGAQNPLSLLVSSNLAVTAIFDLNATMLWTGAGDGTSWSDPANWSGGVVPGGNDVVHLDHTHVAGSYDVVLPGGNATVTVKRLGITSAAGRTIRLELPASSLADPGIQVGDGFAASEDLVLGPGAVLVNRSAAASGHGVALDATGTVRINDGGRYVHATARSANGLASALLGVAGTERGVFEYDVPGTAPFAIEASGLTYGSLVLRRSGGAATYTMGGAEPLRLRGHLRLESGVTLTSTMTDSLEIGGNVEIHGASLVLPASQPLAFTGAAPETLSGAGGLHVLGPGAIRAGAHLVVRSASIFVEGALAVEGTLQLDPGGQALGAGTFSYHPTTGRLVLVPGTSLSIDGERPWPSVAGPSHVAVRGAGVVMQAGRAVPGTLTVGGPILNSHLLTLGGNVELSSAGMLSSPPAYVGEARLHYDAPRAVGNEWIEGASVGVGVPKHVVVRPGFGTVQLPGTGRTVPGDLLIDSGALQLDLDVGEIEVRGNFTTQVLEPIVQGALSLSGAAHQRLVGPSAFTLEYLRLYKYGGAVELECDLEITAPSGGAALELGGNAGELWIAGHQLTLFGAVSGPPDHRRLRGGAGSRLSISTVSGAGGVVGFAAGTEVLQELAVSASGGVTLTSGLLVEGGLTLASGAILTGTNTLALGPAATVVRTGGRVAGRLRKFVPAGSPTVRFEVGSEYGYAPVTLDFTNVPSTGELIVRSIAGDHPTLVGSGLDPARTVNRHWSLEPVNLSFATVNAIFEFVASDRDAGTDPATYAVRRHDGSAWSTPVTGLRTPTSTQALGFAALGTFAIGEIESYPVLAGVERNDRYALRVRFPGASGPIVVDGQSQPLLANLDPQSIAGRTIVVYRDGRAEFMETGGGSVRRGSPPLERGVGATATAAPPPNRTQQLAPSFVRVPTNFTSYVDGTLNPAWADYDGDGDLDLPLYRNDGNGAFTEIPGFRAHLAAGNYHGSSWCDWDADGDVDLVILSYNFSGATDHRTLMLRNDGGVFTNVAPAQGMNVKGRGETAVWGDYDGDGDPDLYTPYHDHTIPDLPDSSLFYRNDGNGQFTERSFAAGLGMALDEPPQKPEGADAVDWDGDGDLDIYVASHLFLNDGSAVFTDVASQVGLPLDFDEGGCFVDYDDDGDFDLYTKNPDSARLLRNDNGHFTNVTASSGLSTTSFLWGDSWADVDNDGDLDLLQYLRNASARLMVNQGNGTFVADPGVAALNLTGGMATWGDYDDDGDLDLLEGTQQDFPYTLNENRLDLQHDFANSYLRVLVLDENGRRNQHRATVELRKVNGPAGRAQARAVGAGATYLSQNEYRVHFGLGVRGSVLRSPELAEYDLGSTVELTAVPATGYAFAGWTGDTTAAVNPLSVFVSRPRDIRAVFEVLTYTVNAGASGGGSVTKSPDQPSYVHGSQIQLTAVPAVGYHFVSWSGDASGAANPVTLTVDGHKSVTATFALNEYSLTALVTGNGTVTKLPDLAAYGHGSMVQLTATPAANHHFVAWSGDATGPTNPLTVTMNGARTITAQFAIDRHPLTVTVVGSGAVIRAPDQPDYDHGTQVQLTATPAANHHFVGWSGDAAGATNPLTVTMDAAKTITATFAIDTRTMQVATVGNGTVAKSPDQPAYDHGTAVTLTATPLPGQAFVGWSGDASGSANPLLVTMDADKTITATFTWSLTVAVQGQGSVTRVPDTTGYVPGSTVELTALPAKGYVFAGWSGDAAGSANPLALTMDGNKNLTASFTQLGYTLAVATVGGGTVTRAPDQPTYIHGTAVTLTANPATGRHFTGWTGDTIAATNPLELTMKRDRSLTANFAVNAYPLTVATSGSGSVNVAPNQPLYDHGTIVTLTAAEGPGYRFTGWSGDTTATANPLALPMTGPRSVTANFGPRPLKKWVGASGGGDGTSWSDARNWNDNAAPSLTDTVVLDHTTVFAAYTVTLPGGGVGVTVARIQVTPGGGNAITLALPATNTANPGLRVGDGIAGTVDLLVGAGGIVRNASGASAGNGLDLSSAANGLVRIEDGGRYVHATLRPATAIASRLQIAPGTLSGEFEYDVPNRNNFAIAASGVTYGALTLTRSAGGATYTASGASPLGVRGTFRLNSGITWSSTMTGALNLGGDLVNAGVNQVFPASQPIQFDGGGLQRVSGASTIAFAGASTVTAPTTLAIASQSFDNNGTMTIDGTFQLDQGAVAGGSGTYQYHATTGTLLFNNTTSLQIGATGWWPTANGPPHVNVLGAGGIQMNVNRTVTGLFQASAVVSRGNRLTLAGTNRLNPGSSWTHTPTYSGNATLLYAAPAEVGPEWTGGTSVGSGVPRHVAIQAAGTVTLPIASRSIPGNLSLDLGTLAFQGGDLFVQGNLHVDGVVALNGGSLFLNGNGVQVLSSSAAATLAALHLDKSSGSVQLAADLTLIGGAGHALEFHGVGEVLQLNGRTLAIGGTVGGSDATAALAGGGTSKLLITGSGALGTLRFAAGSQSLERLSVNRTASGSVTLGTPLTVTAQLELVNGSVVAGSNALTLAPGAALARTSGFVSGGFRKTVPTGAAALTFEVGSGTLYAPVQVAFGNVATSGTLTASATAGDHPQILGSGLDPGRTVNRHWTLTNGGIVFDRYDAVFHYNASDVDAGVNAALLQPRKYNAPDWAVLAVGTRTPTSLQALGMTSFSDFQIGEIQTYTLDVTAVGNGSVARDPDQPVYDSGTSVTLTATPVPGHTFVGWSGSATGTTNPLVVVMNGNKGITASFTWALDVTVVGSGTVTRSPHQPNYAPGTVVNLTAVPATGWHFVGWSGAVTGTTNPIPVTMNGNKTVTATFAINTYTLSLSTLGNGTAARSPDQPTYPHGTQVTLTASPSVGHAFVGWSGAASGTTNPLTITMDANHSVTASFTWGLTVNTAGNGTVTRTPDQANYAPGTVVQLTASPAPGYHLVGWSGDASGTANPLAVTMNGNKTITATFAINTYTVATTVSGSGSVLRMPNQPTYDHGASVQLLAGPATGWHFTGWTGDTTASTNPLPLVVTRNRSLTANFAINTYTLDLTTVGNGSVGRSPNQPTYDHGTAVQLTATPAVGWHFVGWSGDVTGATNPISVTMDDDKSVTATFAINSYTLSVTTSGNGSVAKSPDLPTYDHGTVVQLAATPAVGWNFVGWSGDVTGATNPISVTMDDDKSVTATFAINSYSLSVTTSGNGSVARSPDSPAYDHGTVVQLTATPAVGWHFTGWSGDASGTGNPVSVTMTGPRAVTATFEIDAYTLTTGASGSGSVLRIPNQSSYDHGTEVQLFAAPATGWHFSGWTGDTTASTSPLPLTMTRNRSITGNFAINTYALEVTTAGSGGVARSPDQPAYTHGTLVQLTASPAVGWHFVGWSGDATGSANPVTVSMNDDKTVTATFAINTYSLGVSIAGGGAVAKSPDQPAYDHGTVVQLSATPAVGWHFVGWSGDATGGTNPILVTMTGNRSVTATFAINTYNLGVATAGSGAVAKSPDQPTYTHGTVVQLTATPAVGWSFVGWSGSASGGANPLSVTMDADKNVTATFAINTYTLTTATNGSGGVAKSPDQPSYVHGSVVQLTALPAAGWHFTGWSGDATGTANPVPVTMNGNRSVTASFAINTYALAASVTGSGTVARSPDQELYEHGTIVSLGATPAAGWHFVGWSGAASGTSNPVAVTMDAPKSVTAMFAIDTHPLEVGVTGSGAVARNPDQPLYDHGTAVQLTANPAPGWHLTGWSGDAGGTANPVTVVVDRPKSVTAAFAIDTHALAVTVIGSGAVARSPDQPRYDYGTAVQLTATASPDWHFVAWEGDATGNANPLTVSMDGEKSVTARFALDVHPLTVEITGSGTVAKSPDLAAYEHGTSVTLAATPATGWHFVAWGGDASGGPNPVVIVMDGPRTVTAAFAIDRHPLDVTLVGNGSVARAPDQPLYDYGTSVALTAVPAAGWHFVAWSGDASGTSPGTSVLVDGPKGVTATFAIDTHPLTVAIAGDGAIARSPDQAFYDHGTTVSLTATPGLGQSFLGWSGDASGAANPLVLVVDGPKSVTATFTWSLALATGGSGAGSVAASPNDSVFAPGTVVTLTATPAFGSHFTGWSGDATGSVSPLAVSMDRNRAIIATFELDHYPLDVFVTGSGTIVRSPDLPNYPHGSQVTLTAVPATGWHFVAWTGDVSGGVNPITVTMGGARNVTATFAIDTHTLAVAVEGQGTVTRNPDLPAYDYGSVVQLVAAPALHRHFVRWQGDATGTANPLTVTVDRDLAIEAVFALDTHTLTTGAVGRGIVVSSPDSPAYEYGTGVTVTAVPDSGFLFVGWTGDTTSNGNPLVLTVTRDRSLVAHFIDAQAPKVSVVWANGGEVLAIGSTVDIRWSNTDNVGVASVDVRLSRNGTEGPFETIVLGTAPDGIHSWVVTGPATTRGLFVITVRDSGNNSSFDWSDAPFSITGGSVATPEPVVTEFALAPPAPNPTRGPVTIEYALPVEARVTLTVVDLQGRTVATLAEGQRPAGRHRVTWQASAAGTAAHGVYFVRFRAGGRSFVRRLNVAR